MTQMLTGSGLHKTFRTNGAAVQALRGADLSVNRGEFVAIMGPSGCGKSTLLHLLGGLDSADAGEIFLDGMRVDGLSETAWAKLRRKRIGYVFQAFNLVPNLTVADNVELPVLLGGASSRDAAGRRQSLLDRLGIGDKAGVMPSQLSGGEQQRVAIARALVSRPDVLLADEPTGNLDSQTTREVMAVVKSFHDEGQTTVVVTHDPRVASSADRVVRLRDGVVASETALGGDLTARRLSELIDVGE